MACGYDIYKSMREMAEAHNTNMRRAYKPKMKWLRDNNKNIKDSRLHPIAIARMKEKGELLPLTEAIGYTSIPLQQLKDKNNSAYINVVKVNKKQSEYEVLVVTPKEQRAYVMLVDKSGKRVDGKTKLDPLLLEKIANDKLVHHNAGNIPYQQEKKEVDTEWEKPWVLGKIKEEKNGVASAEDNLQIVEAINMRTWVHSTDSEFATEDIRFNDQLGVHAGLAESTGEYITGNLSEGKIYLHKLKVRMVNPLITSKDPGYAWNVDTVVEMVLDKQYGPTERASIEDIQKTAKILGVNAKKLIEAKDEDSNVFQQVLKEAGYDGVIYKNTAEGYGSNVNSIIIFSKEAITESNRDTYNSRKEARKALQNEMLQDGDPIRSGSHIKIKGIEIPYDTKPDSKSHVVETPFALRENSRIKVQVIGSQMKLINGTEVETIENKLELEDGVYKGIVGYNEIINYKENNC